MESINKCIGQLTLLMTIACFLCGCSGTEVGNPDNGDPAPIINMDTFENDQALERYLKDQYAASALAGDIYRLSAPVDTGTPGDEGFSQINIREANVDEPDVIKTDGAYLYISRETTVSIVNTGDPMVEISRLAIDGQVDSLYRYGSTLVVLYVPTGGEGVAWNVSPPPTAALVGLPYWLPVKASVGVGFFDITDPARPRSIKSAVFDGILVSSRRVDGKLHLVQQFLPDLPPLMLWHDGTRQGRDQAIASNQQALDGLTLDQLVPHLHVTEDDTGTRIDLQTVDSTNLYYPSSRDGGGSIATVVTFDLDDPALNFDAIGVVADVHAVYASTEALYLLTHQFEPPEDPSGGYVQKSAIQKFDLSAPTVQYEGGGRLDGWILNPFSLGAQHGVLRMATATANASGQASHIFCLQIEAGQVEIVGKLENLAPGENICSARFLGDRGFLMPFANMRPVFTIDLSDPARPKIAGKLKVPGHVNYIHPYGDNHLITIGKEVVATDASVWHQGMQLSIFDITDFGNPVLIHKTSIGDRGTESEALYNHKAFAFRASRELLAVPVRLCEHSTAPANPWNSGNNVFNGLLVYRTSVTDGFVFLGRLGDDAVADFSYPASAWMRGVFSEPAVYAVTPDQILSARTDQIADTLQAFDLPAVP